MQIRRDIYDVYMKREKESRVGLCRNYSLMIHDDSRDLKTSATCFGVREEAGNIESTGNVKQWYYI